VWFIVVLLSELPSDVESAVQTGQERSYQADEAFTMAVQEFLCAIVGKQNL
jgi:hypothetical protein